MAKPKFMTFADMVKNQEPDNVIIKDGCIVFLERDYEIDLNRIVDRKDIIQWIHHMTGKRWVTAGMIWLFINKICEYRKIEIY